MAFRLFFWLSLYVTTVLPAFGAGEQRPFPQHTPYILGVLKPSVQNQAALDQAVVAFHRTWKKKYLRPAGRGELYVFCNAEHSMEPQEVRTVSEGHGYGMVATVLMAGKEGDPQAHADFDALYRFFRAHPTQEAPDLMAWRQVAKSKADRLTEGPGDSDSATDGDLDIAYALLLADSQWGSQGEINYRAEACKVMASILAHETDPLRATLTLGNWVDDESPQSGGLRTSDFMPTHLKAFAAASEDSRWSAITDATYRILSDLTAVHSRKTGLLPDFIAWKNGAYRPAPAKFLEGRNDGAFGYNACRFPWRIGADYLLSGDPRALTLLKPLNGWIRQATKGVPGKINAGYALDGRPLKEDNSAAFIGPLAVSAMCDPECQPWLDALWTDLQNRSPATEDYYGNTVKLLTMILISGNGWQPAL